MINRIISFFLIKKAISLNNFSIDFIENNIKNLFAEKGKLIIALVGPPGSGKSYLVRNLLKNSSLFEDLNLKIIDDLKDSEGRKYSKKELKELSNKYQNGILIISDYKACRYLKKVNIIIYIEIDEKERIKNLKRRNSKLFNVYKRKIYSISPIPLRFIHTSLYKISNKYFYLLFN